MSNNAYFLPSDQLLFVANDASAFSPYRAKVQQVPVGVLVPASVAAADTVFYLEQGVLEFMVGGAPGFVTDGSFVRVPAGVAFGYRNAGDEPARLLSRTLPRRQQPASLRIRVDIAAA